jgi:hypothetical protein
MEVDMAGRQAGFRHNEDTRKKIQATQLINRLMDHVMADEPVLDASQVNAAKSLLNKVLPDLKAVEVSGQGDDGSIGITFKTIIEK